jgi:[glutamine synthetase] adenylyltransferase / [glutamine synthetase]-adenylyl-L-tyrosine phosphorylase
MTPEELGRALATAPDPHLARVALSRVGAHPRIRAALEQPGVLQHAVRLLGFSLSAADLLVAHPDEADALVDLRPRARSDLNAELAADVASAGPVVGLRLFRRRSMLRVAALDLAGAAVDDVMAEITAVAETCLSLACEVASPDGGLAVIGLGKLGGNELNYSSDVDILFVHAGGGGERQQQAEREAARLIRLLSEPTSEGVALRVDAALRPGGRAGALSRSVEAMEEHYGRHAATWERQALLKARPVAGDRELGTTLLERLTPFVYPDELAPRAIDEVRATKVRIEDYVRATGKEGVEVKRGRGGIRDVEFAIQLLQLVHGRRDRSLRQPNTLRALAALELQGYVAESDALGLADSYRFLRRLEHRLQMVRDLQTHELPADSSSRVRLARSLGLAGEEELQSTYRRETERVRGLHERLFYRPLLEAFAGPASPRPGVDRDATLELLAGLGFANPDMAYDVLDRLVDPKDRLGRVLAGVFPVMAPALALAANPDAALVRLERVVERLSDARRNHAAEAMAGDPTVARLLANAVAASSFATDLLVSRPELVAGLAVPADADVGPSGSQGHGRAGDGAGRLVATVARYAARELAPRDVGRVLAAMADAVLVRAVADARPGLPLAVIGLGKLGAEELNFASDLDVVFVYEGEGSEAFARATRAAERVISRVRAEGWEPDPDLRPEGRSGPLARSLAAFLEYWERWAKPWEFQSLLRARHVAGDERLGRRFASLASDFAYPEALTVDRVAEMRRMRDRIERERVKPPEATRFHFKLGYGGLADVQFAVELSIMRFGAAYPEVRRRGTLDAIEALAQARLIEDSVSLALGEAFVFLNDVKNAMEVDRRVHAEAVPPAPLDQLALARRLGYEEYPRQAFLEDYRRITRRARRAMERVFHEQL